MKSVKITKFGHSCVLVEMSDRSGLFDPGIYSWEAGAFDIAAITKLDDILITHEHADHMHLPFLNALVSKFPEVTITTTPSVVKKLQAAGIHNAKSEGNDHIKLFSADHESMQPLTSDAPVQNAGIHYQNAFSSPGDSHNFAETMQVLALPITAPWGTTARAAKIIEELQPKYVLPIHDWLWRNEISQKFYQRFEAFCEQYNITFLQPIDGQPIEIEL